jgi:hypothetical protein
MKSLRTFVVALPAVLLAGGAFAAGETVAVFTKNQSNPYFQTVRGGQGCIGTMIALRALRHEPIVDEVVLTPKVVEKSNYQPYEVSVENRSCPTWEDVTRMAR